ncbi:MAG: hypothetical protein LBG59_06315 [Candidatus Peribacteria bacterium]|jgi:hypothetical protein|nr:hypothetical protein [Candidatus Peribacteria bacterium]
MLEAGTLPQQLFLDTVYDRTYYPDVLVHSTAVSLDKSVWKQLMKEYLKETSLIPTKHIEANYMIEPNI